LECEAPDPFFHALRGTLACGRVGDMPGGIREAEVALAALGPDAQPAWMSSTLAALGLFEGTFRLDLADDHTAAAVQIARDPLGPVGRLYPLLCRASALSRIDPFAAHAAADELDDLDRTSSRAFANFARTLLRSPVAVGPGYLSELRDNIERLLVQDIRGGPL